jgi:creatinine amidohydrolase
MINLITTATAKDERDRDAKIALLPIGSFEQHGDYLPLITDTVVACAIANEIAKAHPVMLLPPITVSCSHEHAAWRGTVSISSQTLYRIVTEATDSVRRSGIEHVAVINGHGGNYVLNNVVQEYASTNNRTLSLFPNVRQWDEARASAGIETDGHSDMHAGELETSVLLHIAPTAIKAGNETADWAADDRPLMLTFGLAPYTKSGVIGRPSLGTSEKGRRLLEHFVRAFGQHLARVTAGSTPY